ncbi:MAG: hypothetical protein HONDAALG_01571 [Gammaproteobacteria bacterium]|nr:hypothetical protein [Gammaproteobacteria bacterium]
MSDSTHVYGLCQYEGDVEKVERIVEEWGLISLLITLEQGAFILDGPYHPSVKGPHDPVQEEHLQDCLNELSDAIRIQKAEFRCYGPEAGQVWDLIYVDGEFLRIPLELQPTLDAFDDPMVREYYGVEYSLV